MSKYTFKGQLCAQLCGECIEYLDDATIKVYQLRKGQQETVLASASTKHTIRLLDPKEVKAKDKELLATASIDAAGNYCVELPKSYEGGAIEVDVSVEKLPGERDSRKLPLQIALTVLQPQWRIRDDIYVAAWNYCISERFWCWLRERLGRYVICGRVLDCQQQQDTPIPGVLVKAFDRDWLQDDSLGEALTDASGEFRIYYTKDDFVPGTFINVELFGGPDVYFHVETTLGAPILIEEPSRGRAADRKDRRACFCVLLCAEEVPEVTEAMPFFSHLGSYDYESDVDSNFGASGLTNASNRAFYSTVRLNGVLSKTLAGAPMEYRFEYREVNASGSAIGAWTNIAAGNIAKTKIGSLQRANPAFPVTSPNPIKNVDYVVGSADADELSATINNDAGIDWIQVPQESSSPLSAAGFFQPDGNMIKLRTTDIPGFIDKNLSGANTGSSSTSGADASLAENRYFSIRMRVRQVGTASAGSPAGLCRQVAINNVRYNNIDSHPDWAGGPKSNQIGVAMVNIAQLTGPGTGCNGISTDLDVTFTAAHPTLGAVNISMNGPGGPYPFTLPAVATAGDHFGTAAIVLPAGDTVSDLPPCAYIVTLSVQVLLTTGDSSPDNLFDQIAFCKS